MITEGYDPNDATKIFWSWSEIACWAALLVIFFICSKAKIR